MKIHRWYFTIVLLSFSLSTFSQEADYQKIAAQIDDTKKVDQLCAFGIRVSRSNPEIAKKTIESAVVISQKLGYNYGLGIALKNLGILKIRQFRRLEAQQHLYQALNCFKKESNDKEVAITYLCLCENYEYLGKVDSAFYCNVEAVKSFENTNDKKNLYYAYYDKASLFDRVKDVEKSLEYYLKALNIIKGTTDKDLLLEVYAAISKCLIKKKEYAQASQLANETLAIAQGPVKRAMKVVAFNNKSRLLLEMGKVDSAIFYGMKAYDSSSNSVVAYQPYSHLLDSYNRFYTLVNLAEAYSLKQEERKNVSYLNEALSIAEQTKELPLLTDIYARLSALAFEQKHYKEAYIYEKKYNGFRDVVVKEKNSIISAEMEVRYQAAQKEKALAENQLEIAHSRIYMFWALTALVVCLAITAIIFMQARNRKKNHARELQNLHQEKQLHVLQALMQGEEIERSRIAKDLHDGVAGMLSAVKLHFRSLALQLKELGQYKEYRQGLELLDETALEVRKTSHNLMPELLMKYGLDEALRRYCNNISNDHLLAVQYDCWGEVGRYKESFELLVYRVVQELLNNIVKHSQADTAVVQMTAGANILFISIEDNGIGFKNAVHTEGVGLQTLRERVEAMQGSIEFDSGEGRGVNAYLKFDTAGLERKFDVYESNSVGSN